MKPNKNTILYLFNPEANRGRAKRMKKKITHYLEELGIMGEFIELRKIGEASDIAQEALKRDIKIIVAVGGDGIINEIIQKIADEDITLGIIPIGEANLLASILRIDSWQKGCEALMRQKIINMDLGLAGNRYFSSSVEIENKEEPSRFLGIFPSKKIKKYYPVSINIDYNESSLKLQTNIFSILISTIPIPLPSNLNLEETLTDGKLNILIKSKPWVESKKIKKKNGDEVSQLEGNKINIKSKNPIIVKADGEICDETPINISIVPHCLKVIVPQ